MTRSPATHHLLALLSFLPLAAGTGCYGLPGCRVNLDCPSGQICQAGSCQPNTLRGCTGDSSCGSGEVCINSVCQPDCATQGCPQGQRCDDQSHRCLALVFASATSGGGTSGTTGGGTTSGTTTGTSTGGTTGPPPAAFCSPCTSTSCGPVTSVCLQDARGFNFCGTDCTDGQPCPTGAQCFATSKFNPNNAARIYNCFPSGFLCYCVNNGDTWMNYAQALFTNKCQSCHSQYPTTLANFQFTSYANVSNVAARIQVQLAYSYMPLSPVSLTPDDRVRLLNWLDCGLKEQ